MNLTPLCNALDYMTGRALAQLPAVLDSKSQEEKLHALRALRQAVACAVEAKLCMTAPDSRKRAETLLAEARGESAQVIFEILSTFAAHRAPLTHRKVLAALDGEIFRTRQLGLPGVA